MRRWARLRGGLFLDGSGEGLGGIIGGGGLGGRLRSLRRRLAQGSGVEGLGLRPERALAGGGFGGGRRLVEGEEGDRQGLRSEDAEIGLRRNEQQKEARVEESGEDQAEEEDRIAHARLARKGGGGSYHASNRVLDQGGRLEGKEKGARMEKERRG